MKNKLVMFFIMLIISEQIFSADFVPGRVIVKFDTNLINFPSGITARVPINQIGINSPIISNLINQNCVTFFEQVFKNYPIGKDSVFNRRTGQFYKVPDLSDIYIMEFPTTIEVQRVIERFRLVEGIKYIHPDYIAENCEISRESIYPIENLQVTDPDFNLQWYLKDLSQYGINIEGAWSITHGDPSVIIAMVESGNGPYVTHPDLIGKNYYGSWSIDENYHPTKTTGIAAANTDNGIGIAGVAFNCRYMPIESSSNLSSLSNKIEQSANNGADVINNSWINQNGGNVIYEAIEHAFFSGSVCVAAMGNSFNNGGNLPYAGVPAVLDLGIISVGGTDQTGTWWPDANYGSFIDVSAPANDIWTTVPPPQYYDFTYGTSFSAPMVSGVAALLLSKNTSLTPDDVEKIISISATDVVAHGIGWDQYTGHGIVNANAALNLLCEPYSIQHVSITGGSAQKVIDNGGWWIQNYIFSNIATEIYVGDCYKVTRNISFPKVYQDPPHVWVRINGIDRNGWPYAESNHTFKAKAFCDVKNITTTGCTFETYIYDLKNEWGQPIGIWPKPATSIRFDYTVLGIEAPPPPLSVAIEGPTTLNKWEFADFTANPNGGSGTYIDYKWWKRFDGDEPPDVVVNYKEIAQKNGYDPEKPPPGTWTHLSYWDGYQTIHINSDMDFSLKCEVTDSDYSTAIDIHSVTVLGGGGQDKGSVIVESELNLIPSELELKNNYPNPFNPTTNIMFGLPEDNHVVLNIYSLTGQKINTLVDSDLEKGFHTVVWNGRDRNGAQVASGVYIYELLNGEKRLVNKMFLMK